MAIAISSLTTPVWTTMTDGQPLPAATLNNGINNGYTAIGNLNSVVAELENSFAGASAPTDKPAGKWWFNSSTLLQQYYEVANGTLRTVATLDGTQTLTNKTLMNPTITGSGGTTTYAIPDTSARTLNVAGTDQNSYISGTGTTGNSNTNVKSIPLKANSLTAGRALKIFFQFSGSGAAAVLANFCGLNIFPSNTFSGTNGYAEYLVSCIDSTHINYDGFLYNGLNPQNSYQGRNSVVSSLTADQTIVMYADGTHNITVYSIILVSLG